MFDRLKQIFDMDTAKVLAVGIGGITANMILIDLLLKVVIGGLTIWYLLKKIRNEK